MVYRYCDCCHHLEGSPDAVANFYRDHFVPEGWELNYFKLSECHGVTLTGHCDSCYGKLEELIPIPGELTGDDLFQAIYDTMQTAHSYDEKINARYYGNCKGRSEFYQSRDKQPQFRRSVEFLELFNDWDREAALLWLEKNFPPEKPTEVFRDTGGSLFSTVVRLAKANGDFDKAGAILDYHLPCEHETGMKEGVKLTAYEFDFVPMPNQNNQALRDRMLAVMADVNAQVAEREELVEAIAIALLTRKNLFILGAPGQAKSYAINQFRARITGARQFERLLSKQTDEEQLFGRVDLSSLIPGSVSDSVAQNDDVFRNLRFNLKCLVDGLPGQKDTPEIFEKLKKHTDKLMTYRAALAALHSGQPQVNTSGKLPEADIVFLDEIFKCNDGVLNSLLTALNERKYTNEGRTYPIPVVSFFAASNEIPNFNDPQEKILEALYDRLELKVVTDNIADRDKRLAVLADKQAGRSGQIAASITLDELERMQQEVADIPVPDAANELAAAEKLPSFPALSRDVFQSFYSLLPRKNEDGALSVAARKFNGPILEHIIQSEDYPTLKSVCEGRELPAYEAASEFITRTAGELDSLLADIGGEKNGLNTLEKLEDAEREARKELAGLLARMQAAKERNQLLEQSIVDAANKAESKRRQVEAVSKLVDANAAKSKGEVATVVSQAVRAASEKAEEVQNIIGAWSDEPGNLEKSEVNAELLALVRKSPVLRDIAKYLGRFREIFAQGKRNGYAYGRGEKYSLELGRDLSRAITSELAMLASPQTMPLFLRKYQRGQIKQYQRREPIYKGMGDIICCLDESASTKGDPAAWGKAVALTLLEIAADSGHRFALIHFSGPGSFRVDVFQPGEYGIEGKLRSAETFLSGGTDFRTPMEQALLLMEMGGFENADIVFITDGECQLPDEYLEQLHAEQAAQRFTVTGVLLDKGSLGMDFSLKSFCQNIYRTSELLGDDIVRELVNSRV